MQTESGRLRSQGMQYRRLMLLGTGGMATVHLALAAGPSGFNRLVVVKAMRDELLQMEDARAMFLDEARLCARLNHPNVVQVSEVVDSAAGVMIVMEYLDGRPLSAIYNAGESFTLAMRLRVVCEVLAGLHYVHELKDFEGESLGLVHRDVSPHNVFITFDGRVKLLDFGIAKVTADSDHTKTGIVKGKLTYMPSEQLRGRPVDRRSDIYSVGCILWETIAGSRIWAKRPDKDIMQSVLRGELPPLSSRVEVDPELEQIVMRATALNPEHRYATAEEMRLELERILNAAPPTSPRAIGEFLSGAYADARQQRQEEVAQLIAALPETDAGAEVVAVEPRTAVGPSAQVESLPPPPKRAWLAVLLVVGLLATAALAAPRVLQLFARSTQTSEALSTSAPQVVLSVAVVPSSARLTVDNEPATVGNARVQGARGSEHVVRAESDGYSSVERRVTLVSDTSMLIELDLKSPQGLIPASSASASASAKAEPARKSAVRLGRNPHFAGTAPSTAGVAPVAKPAAGQVACSPPYYFVGGIKTFKPECL